MRAQRDDLPQVQRVLGTLAGRGYSMSELERLLGLSYGYLSKLKGRRAKPSYQLVALLALLESEPNVVARLRALRGVRSPSPSERRALAALLSAAPLLDERGVPWAIGGATALEALGIGRPTTDVDVFIPDEGRAALVVLRDTGLALAQFNEDHAAAFPSDAGADDRIDVHFVKPQFLRDGIAQHRVCELRGRRVPILAPLALTLMKLMSPRRIEGEDAARLLAAGAVSRAAVARALRALAREQPSRDPWTRRQMDPQLARARLKDAT